MVTMLAGMVPTFQGDSMRSRCFAHILNLVVKSILHRFERGHGTGSSGDDGDDDDEVLDLDTEGDGEEEEEEEEEEEKEDDNVRGWQDEGERMGAAERAALDKGIEPVRSMLGKVRQISTVWQLRGYSRVSFVDSSPNLILPILLPACCRLTAVPSYCRLFTTVACSSSSAALMFCATIHSLAPTAVTSLSPRTGP